jgi:hypothetical protein
LSRSVSTWTSAATLRSTRRPRNTSPLSRTSEGIVLRLRTNTVRTEHRTFYSSINVRVTTTTHNATLRFSKDYHHFGNASIRIHCNIRIYVHCYVHWCLGYVQTVIYVSVHALLLNRHLIALPYCGRILSMTISIANKYI